MIVRLKLAALFDDGFINVLCYLYHLVEVIRVPSIRCLWIKSCFALINVSHLNTGSCALIATMFVVVREHWVMG